MHNRIAYHILSLLYLNGRVRIPGIGKIVREQKPAEISQSATQIKPPQADNSFTEGKNGKNRLLEKFVAYRTNSSRTKARREIARFGHDVKAGLKNEGKVELKYLGTFSRQGDAIHFSPNEEILNPGYTALQPVPLPSVVSHIPEMETMPYAAADIPLPMTSATTSDESFQQHEESIVEEPTQPAPAESSPEIPAPVITPPPALPSFEKVEPIIPPQSETPVTPAPITTAPTRVAKTPPPAIAKKKSDLPIALPIAALVLLGLLVAAFLFYQKRVAHQESVTVMDTTAREEQRNQLPSEEQEQTTTDLPQTAQNEQTETGEAREENKIALADTGMRDKSEEKEPVQEHITQETETSAPIVYDRESVRIATGACLIALGAFAETANTERMVSRLQAMGFTTVTNPRGQLTQVGVPVDCEADNLEVVLDFLRKNIEKEAWVRGPK